MTAKVSLLVATSFMLACATGTPSASPASEQADFVQVVLHNNSTLAGPRRIYVRWDGFNRRQMGELAPGESMTLTLIVEGSTLQIEFYPAESISLSVIPGERIDVTLDARGVRSQRLPSRVRAPAGN
jgi:hypothetical protein